MEESMVERWVVVAEFDYDCEICTSWESAEREAIDIAEDRGADVYIYKAVAKTLSQTLVVSIPEGGEE